MSKPRKLWKITQGWYGNGVGIDPSTEQRVESKTKVYGIYVPNAAAVGSHDFVSVWVDERDGQGFQLYERIDLSDYRRSHVDAGWPPA